MFEPPLPSLMADSHLAIAQQLGARVIIDFQTQWEIN